MDKTLGMESELSGRDLVPVIIVGAIYGAFFALIVREVAGGFHRAELSDMITKSIRLGSQVQKEVDLFKKEKHDKASQTKKRRSVAGAKSSRNTKAK